MNDRSELITGLIRSTQGFYYIAQLQTFPNYQVIVKKDIDVLVETLNVIGSFKTVIVIICSALVMLARWAFVHGSEEEEEHRKQLQQHQPMPPVVVHSNGM